MRFPVATVIARPMRSALVCKPGKSFGQLVASLNSRIPCEIAGAGNAAAAAAAAPAFTIMPRRVIGALEPDGWPSDGVSQPDTCRHFSVQIDMASSLTGACQVFDSALVPGHGRALSCPLGAPPCGNTSLAVCPESSLPRAVPLMLAFIAQGAPPVNQGFLKGANPANLPLMQSTKFEVIE